MGTTSFVEVLMLEVEVLAILKGALTNKKFSSFEGWGTKRFTLT